MEKGKLNSARRTPSRRVIRAHSSFSPSEALGDVRGKSAAGGAVGVDVLALFADGPTNVNKIL